MKNPGRGFTPCIPIFIGMALGREQGIQEGLTPLPLHTEKSNMSRTLTTGLQIPPLFV
jgi:hypothetical protein